MDSKEKVINEIKNACEMIEMLLKELEKLEERVNSGAICNEDAIEYAKSWENAINTNYKEIDILKKQLFN